MLCTVIKGPEISDAFRQIRSLHKDSDAIELRLDCFRHPDFDRLARLRSQLPVKVIFTLRDRTQGGEFPKSESERMDCIRRFAQLKPDYFDLESHLPDSFLHEFARDYPGIKRIISRHDECFPQNVESIVEELQTKPGDLFKFVVKADSSIDTFRMLEMVRKCKGKLIGIASGEIGQVSRILGPVFGTPITYVRHPENEDRTLGQLTCEESTDVYDFRKLNPDTAIYGLIGDPVDRSLGHCIHNAFYRRFGIDAVYVKIPIRPDETEEFLRYAVKLKISGLSVTMPLKEIILPYLDATDSQARSIGAVNTLLFEEEKVIGFNTDGKGALDALEKAIDVREKTVCVLGAGGVARAIVFEALRRGARVIVLNRTEEKALRMAEKFSCEWAPVSALNRVDYDALVNCTSIEMPIDPSHIRKNKSAMDVSTIPVETDFLRCAKAADCRIVRGFEMFVLQAVGQVEIWLKNRYNSSHVGRLFRLVLSKLPPDL